MSLQIASLNSGSNANCYYAGNNNEAVLIDAGLSCRETENRMKQLGLSMDAVKALFISHEHYDHISGMPGIAKKYKLPVYITTATLQNCPLAPNTKLVRSFSHAKPVIIGSLKILPFRKSHDADDPHSFMISGNGVNIGVITDIGYACKRVIRYFSQCHAAFLETNYCPDMLANGDYPYHLKKRISSDKGHLSNDQALELFRHYGADHLQLLILSHLSKNNNRPDLVESVFKPHAGKTRIVVASRYHPGPVFSIETEGRRSTRIVKQRGLKNEKQLSLF